VRRAGIVLVVLAAALVGPGDARAEPPLVAAGTAQATSLVFTDSRTADGNTILEGVQQGVMAGTFTGTWIEQFRVVFHASGRTSFHSFLTFTGTVAGCGTGTVPFIVEGQGEGPVTEGHLGTVNTSENTADVHAELSFSVFVPTGTIAYSGTYHCG
jgi:hypothetical protein